MVSTVKLDEKYNIVKKHFCFYLDIQDHGLARSLSRRIQDMGLQQEVFLTSRVSHVVRQGGSGAPRPALCAPLPAHRDGRRAGAMLDRVRTDPSPPRTHHNYITLTVQKAITLLDRLYDTFLAAKRNSHVRLFTKHFIKIEFLDKSCRPVFKEFDEWPAISTEIDPPREKKDKKETTEIPTNNNAKVRKTTAGQKMTRKSRPRVKDKEEKGGYCEMCNAEYVDATLHRRSPHHLAFVRDHTNFLALDELIAAGADVAAFLDKAGAEPERRSARPRRVNGEAPPAPASAASPASPATVNGTARRPRRTLDKNYYKVVGVSTKLRSSGAFAKKKESPPRVNGEAEPLVVKFRKVRRSELSVLSDEAEQFMFPRRASSSSSTSDDDNDEKRTSPRRRTPPQPPPTVSTERRRLARPTALKEESSEEDSWPEDKRRRKRRGPTGPRRVRRQPLCKTIALELPVEPDPPPEPEPVPEPEPAAPEPPPTVEEEATDGVSPPPPVAAAADPAEEVERCMRWEDGRLRYTPAVEQLEFAFESVPRSEPWFDTFRRQDASPHPAAPRNIPHYFSLYSSKAPKLPYEIGQLPPLKPNCCPLSDLVLKREEKPGPSRSYGTRGMKKQKISKKRTAALLALEAHPRKSPREHASTLAILGSAGLLNRRKLADDTKSTASEDTISDVLSNLKVEPVGRSEAQEASERLKLFLSEVFEDAAEYDLSEEVIEGEPAVATSTAVLDVSSLVSECEDCDLIRNELKQAAERPKARRGKFKKKNRTGWPNKKKVKKDSRTNSLESDNKTESLDRSSAEPPDDETTQDMISEEDTNMSEPENDHTIVEKKVEDTTLTEDTVSQESMDVDSDNKLLIDLKVVLDNDKKEAEKEEKKSGSEGEDKEIKKKKRALQGLCEWLQPVVRVARVDPVAARRLRSAARPPARPSRHR